MKDRVTVRQGRQGLTGLIVEQIVDGHVRLRACVWRELREGMPVWHGFRGIFGTEPLRDAKGQLRPAGRGGDIADRLEDFEEHTASTLGKFLVWAVPE